MANDVRIVGRRSSHFTRVATMFAHELDVTFDLVAVPDLTSTDAADYGGHPALKVPSLQVDDAVVFGTENVCRRLVTLSGRAKDPRVVFPEQVTDDLGRNAHELTWHAMTAQVQLVVSTLFGKVPRDNAFVAKTTAGLVGSLAWLDTHLAAAIEVLPTPRDVSLFELALFCLVEHFDFRRTLTTEPYVNLRRFAAEYGTRPSARRTPYR